MIAIISFVLIFSILILIVLFTLKRLSKTNTQQNININNNMGTTSNRQVNNNNADSDSEEDGTRHNGNNNQGREDTLVSSRQQSTVQFDPDKKYTKKELYKMEKKKAKEEARENIKMMQMMKKQREEEREREMRERELKREDEKLKEDEMIQRIKNEQAKREQMEFDKWKGGFAVAEEGEETEDVDTEDMINEFVNYIKLRKVVALEDLAGQFKINPNEIVERLKFLEQQGRICGIVDDRGKYIYLTEKEIVAIEKIFMVRGRISKSDLIKECNKIIRFQPTDEDKEKILEEQNKILKVYEDELDKTQNRTK
jgi:hypothetical protein